jgi:hypothetical protein
MGKSTGKEAWEYATLGQRAPNRERQKKKIKDKRLKIKVDTLKC